MPYYIEIKSIVYILLTHRNVPTAKCLPDEMATDILCLISSSDI